MNPLDLKPFLDDTVGKYNRPEFIENDPISIPHLFTATQDIEIMGFWAAVLSWGQRPTILKKCNVLIGLMDNAPYDFIKNHKEADRKRFEHFVHRTFNFTDTLYFLHFLQKHYKQHPTLETAFTIGHTLVHEHTETALKNFYTYFFDDEHAPKRTRKHISTPQNKSACKRLNMFLRWMVRHDDNGVDFGIWKAIQPSQLVCPCDLHVERIARKLSLITRKGVDWQTALELTQNLKVFDPLDPVKYDFALFGLGVNNDYDFL